MGAGGQEFGLAVYDQPGSIRRVGEAVQRGRMEVASRVLATAVTFDAEPAWAAKAFCSLTSVSALASRLRMVATMLMVRMPGALARNVRT